MLLYAPRCFARLRNMLAEKKSVLADLAGYNLEDLDVYKLRKI